MIFRRHRFASLLAGGFLFLACVALPPAILAQEAAESPAAPATPLAAPSTGLAAPETPPVTPPAATPADEAAPTKPATPAEALSVNGGYGFLPQSFTPGEGRLAKPKLRFSVSITQGYDNNIFGSSGKVPPTQTATTGTNGQSQQPGSTTRLVPVPPVTVVDIYGNTIVFIPASPKFIVVVTPPPSTATPPPQPVYYTTIDGNLIGFIPVTGTTGTITTGTTAPRTTQQPTVRPVPPRGIEGSATTGVNLRADIQFASPRSVLALDLTVGALYYFNPDEPLQESVNFNLIYIHRISSRLQLNAQVSAGYQNQPNFSQANAPTQSNPGNYYNGTLRLDLAYQFSGRIQAESTYTIQTQLYAKPSPQNESFYLQTFGESLRYSLTPRTGIVAEGRYSFSTYQSAARNNSSTYLLTGLDLNLSTRMAGTFRFGEQIQTADATGKASTSPYFESTLSYLYGGGASRLTWTSRYGFEQSSSASMNNLTFRTGLGINQAINARFQSGIGVNYLRTTQSTPNGGITQSSDDIDLTLNLLYIYNPKLSFTGNLSHTQVLSTNPFQSYSRDRVSIGANYSF